MIKKLAKILGLTMGITGITAGIATAITMNLPMANLEQTNNTSSAFSICNRILIKEERKVGSDLWRPISTSGQDDIYCIQPGAPLKVSEYTPEEIEEYDGNTSPSNGGFHCRHPAPAPDGLRTL